MDARALPGPLTRRSVHLAGFLAALAATVTWAWLPIVVQHLGTVLTPVAISGFRLVAAAVVFVAFEWRTGLWPALAALASPQRLLLLVAAAGTLGSYVFTAAALQHLPAGALSVLVQLQPMLLLFVSVVWLKERLSVLQWLGFATLLIGMPVFFSDRLHELREADTPLVVGLAWVLLSAVCWVAFALAQRRLQRSMAPNHILAATMAIAGLLLTPFWDVRTLDPLEPEAWIALLLAGANSVLAYGAFAFASKRWDVSRISATLAAQPVFTLLMVQAIASAGFAGIATTATTAPQWIGAFLVVLGSLVCALGGRPA
jgi:drug/metabolite transporter (DMT)-like permease